MALTEKQQKVSSMTIDDRAVLLSQLTSSIGLQINPGNAKLILEMLSLIDDKGESVTLADLNHLMRRYSQV